MCVGCVKHCFGCCSKSVAKGEIICSTQMTEAYDVDTRSSFCLYVVKFVGENASPQFRLDFEPPKIDFDTSVPIVSNHHYPKQ